VGYNTAVMILNDGFGELERHPADFVRGIFNRLGSGGTFGVGGHGNVVTVHSSIHADALQLIAVGGNHTTRVFADRGGRELLHHHDRDGQVAILRAWANQLGYDVVPQGGPKPR
jgi:hypothetical protein